MTAKITQNSPKAEKKKRGGKPFVKGDPRINKGGRPKNEQSVTHYLHEFGQLTPVELSKRCALYAETLKAGGNDMPIFALIAIRQLMSLMNDSDARLVNAILDRTEGKVAQPIEWRQKVKDAGLDPDAVVKQVEAWLAETSEESEPESG